VKLSQVVNLSALVVILIACNSLPSPFLAQLNGEYLYRVQGTKIHSPVWSRDGSAIVFNSTDFKTGKSSLYHLDLNTLAASLLIKDEYLDIESLSTENEIVLSGLGGIWITTPEYEEPLKVSSFGQTAAWAPVGRTLAVFENKSSSSGERLEALHIIDLTEKKDNVIFTIAVREEFAANNVSWSPDGTKIAFSLTTQDYGSGANIYILELKNNKLIQLTDDKNYNRQPVWSPSSRVIAYLSSPPKTQAAYIVFSSIDGTCITKSENIGSVDITWSPDGRFLVFTRDDTLYRLDLFEMFGEKFFQEDVSCK
jgi:Tol biopolymer transport system component